MKIHDLIWDEAVYPRSAVNQRTVEAYVEALSIGAQFPAVLVQRVVNYTPAAQEDPGRSITLFDYHRLLTQTGWKVIRRIECPLSSERLTGNQVKKMQDKRILGTIGRTLLIARRT
jgi:hypothetical protein